MDGWIFLSSASTAVRKPGPLSILCVPVCCRYIPPRCSRVTDQRKRLLWLAVRGCTVHSSRDVGAWGSWSHSICSQEPERDDCLYSFSFLFSQEPQTMEQCHPESEGVFPPFLKYPHRPPEVYLLCISKSCQDAHQDPFSPSLALPHTDV